MKKTILLCYGLLVAIITHAQTTAPLNDVNDQRIGKYLFTNAVIHVDGNTTIENGELLVEKNRIIAVGKNISKPKGVIIVDLKGKHIFPSFVDPYSNYGMPEVKRPRGGSYYATVLESDKKGAYAWNAALKPENNAVDLFTVNKKAAEELRKAGFGAVITNPSDGILRGTSSLVGLSDGKENEVIIKEKVSANFSLDKGSSPQSYPVSMMGSVALLRQAHLDADWYKKGGSSKEKNVSLEALNSSNNLPQVFEANDILGILRADRIGDELGKQFIIVGGGDEYQKVNDLKKTNAKLIIPLNFPELKDVEDPYDAELVSLKELKHWEMAPSNLGVLSKNGLNFAITANGLKKADFLKNLRKAITYGLEKSKALDAITSTAAELYGISDLGKIKNGYLANFIITENDILEKEGIIYENWIQGKSFVLADKDIENLAGNYKMTVGDSTFLFSIKGDVAKPTYTLMKSDSSKVDVNVSKNSNLYTISFKDKLGLNRLSGYSQNGLLIGKGLDSKGNPIAFKTEKLGASEEIKKKEETKSELPKIGEVTFPFQAFGNKELPSQETVLIKNATIWTNEAQGIIEKGDVLVQNGRISKVGNNLSAGSAKEIDGSGMHLTSGIIDEHTHIALFSINEVESVSAEVRQRDVIDSEDIDIYRQLAGGVTAAQLLHGSADCIGGQSALIKFRWGSSPDDLLIKDAQGFIKFALGENVKRGNSPQAPNRYPSTRMGVEQIMRDAFSRAKNYETAWSEYNSLKNKTGVTPPRRDLELETIVEILNGKRNITCHSYVQSEINMLMKVADEMGFKVNTFTHILEGYKVADKMKAHGANASTFSDWWAYKMEVKEAIPYNASIMNKVGVNVAINSDDAEMARRLNQEAGKIVLYGGISEQEAWKMVTLNPAKMLHLDNKMGSIKEGKDADLVLWTANPLSVYARPQFTMVDGIIYFDADKDKIAQKEVLTERNRIIQKMIAEKKGGSSASKPVKTLKPDVHCDSVLEYGGVSVENLEEVLNNSSN